LALPKTEGIAELLPANRVQADFRGRQEVEAWEGRLVYDWPQRFDEAITGRFRGGVEDAEAWKGRQTVYFLAMEFGRGNHGSYPGGGVYDVRSGREDLFTSYLSRY
jgi:hypothetical protein